MMRIEEFKKIIHEISQKLYLKVGKIYASEFTPNFHTAEISGQETIFVLCNENDEWAFSSYFDTASCNLKFIDFEKFSELLKENYYYAVNTAEDLNGPFKMKDYLLESDINYWRPQTLGEGLYNWWD